MEGENRFKSMFTKGLRTLPAFSSQKVGSRPTAYTAICATRTTKKSLKRKYSELFEVSDTLGELTLTLPSLYTSSKPVISNLKRLIHDQHQRRVINL